METIVTVDPATADLPSDANELMLRAEQCATHHYACDCREYGFELLYQQLLDLRAGLDDAYALIYSPKKERVVVGEAGYWYPPEQSDSKWDIYYNDFELWLNEHYDMEAQSIAGTHMTWEDACESDALLDQYIQEREEAIGEARAERDYYDSKGH